MKAMIFAAGLGTRLKPLTDTLPKALVPVNGHPLIWHVLRKLMTSGTDEAVVNVHHFAGQVEEWLAGESWVTLAGNSVAGNAAFDMYGKPDGCVHEGQGITVYVSDEREMLLETGGAVMHARPYLEGCGHFIVHNVDILSNCDLMWFESQVRNDAMATLLVSRRKTSRCLLFEPASMRLAGWTDTRTGEVRMSGLDIDPASCLTFAFSGIHIMSDSIFGVMERYVSERNLRQENSGVRFPVTDFYLASASRNPIYGVCCDSLEVLDVGKLDALGPAEDFVKKWQNY